MTIALCDDEEIFLAGLRSDVQKICIQYNWMCEINTYTAAKQLISYMRQKRCDVIFLDIDMPEMNGFDVAEQIKKINADVMIVFCTSHNELVYDSFGYEPFWFICKYHYQDILENVLQKARKRMAEIHQEIEFVVNEYIHRFEVKHIIFIDVLKHKIGVHIHEAPALEFRGKIGEIEKRVEVFGFVKINSGTIVNMAWIKHIHTTEVVLKNEVVLPVSRGKGGLVKRRFNEYMRGGK